MRTLKGLLDVMDNGDPLTDKELDFLIEKHEELTALLSEFGRSEYSLMYRHAATILVRLDGYKEARNRK